MSVKSDSVELGKFVAWYMCAVFAAVSFLVPWVLVIHIYQFGYPVWLWATVPMGWVFTCAFGLAAMRIERTE